MIKAIIIGAFCGWIASMIMKKDAQMGAMANIVVGLIGGALGGWILDLLHMSTSGFFGELVSGILGSVVLLYIYNLITNKKETK